MRSFETITKLCKARREYKFSHQRRVEIYGELRRERSILAPLLLWKFRPTPKILSEMRRKVICAVGKHSHRYGNIYLDFLFTDLNFLTFAMKIRFSNKFSCFNYRLGNQGFRVQKPDFSLLPRIQIFLLRCACPVSWTLQKTGTLS